MKLAIKFHVIVYLTSDRIGSQLQSINLITNDMQICKFDDEILQLLIKFYVSLCSSVVTSFRTKKKLISKIKEKQTKKKLYFLTGSIFKLD